MCENQLNTKQTDDIKMVHSQYSRILKEEDEMWISSEDLNTENSSDDEKSKRHNANKKKSKVKNRKRSSTNLKPLIAAYSATTSTSPAKSIDERLTIPSKPAEDCKYSDEECSGCKSTTRTLSFDCSSSRPKNRFDTKRLSLEDWRPTKGALNISSLEDAAAASADDQATINEGYATPILFKEIEYCKYFGQFNELDDENPAASNLCNSKSYDKKIQKKIDSINKLDEEINEIINTYKKERSNRMKIETDLCNDLKKMTLTLEKNTAKFLELCNVEKELNEMKVISEIPVSTEAIESEIQVTVEKQRIHNIPKHQTDFIKKNISAAKAGTMAGFYLTDEQKIKIAELMKDIEDVDVVDLPLPSQLEISSEKVCDNNSEEISINSCKNEELSTENIPAKEKEKNAFRLALNDKIRIDEIDEELKNFIKEDSETVETNSSIDQKYDHVSKEQTMQNINLKLSKLYESYLKDDENLKLCSEGKFMNVEELD